MRIIVTSWAIEIENSTSYSKQLACYPTYQNDGMTEKETTLYPGTKEY
jgi:hypothetical protein